MNSLSTSSMKKLIVVIVIVTIALVVAIIMLGRMISNKKDNMPKNIVVKSELSQNDSEKNNIKNPININSNKNTTNNILNGNNINDIQNDVENTNTSNLTNTVGNNVSSNAQNNLPINNEQTLNNFDNSQDLDIIVKDKKKASIQIKYEELSVTSATIIITDTNNKPFVWGPGFKIQVKQNEIWKDLEPLQEMNFEEISYELNENNQYEEKIDWTNYYGALGVGNYRIVKSVNYNGEVLEFYAEIIVN